VKKQNKVKEKLFSDEAMPESLQAAAEYMRDAVKRIDHEFGDGYAVKHPSLIGAFMQTAAANFHTGVMSSRLEDMDYIGTALDHLTEALEKK
jgi:uncharacterized alpha-E superfamily protein